jgi:steroid 5-alpha reductase family enzyme
MNPFAISAVAIFCFMCLMFVIALIKKDNSVADIGWGLGFILVMYITLFQNEPFMRKHKLMEFLILAWGLRLSSYIAIRNWGKPEDFRYANWRKEWGSNFLLRSFLQVFMLQGLIMFIVSLPIIIVNSNTESNQDFRFLYMIGAGVWFVGFFFETLGDHQMFMFKSDVHNNGKVMNKGLWKYTRHPNYFGESLQWWGVFLIAIPSGWWYVSIVSPVLITFLLLRVSGVTLLEKKYEGNDKYALYKKQTNAFIPWLPKKL